MALHLPRLQVGLGCFLDRQATNLEDLTNFPGKARLYPFRGRDGS
jgi:hypothetical protein